MGASPSIKGAVISKLVDDVRALLERSGAGRERLEARLSPGTLTLLDGKVDIGRWYPIEQYAELTELLWKEEGGGSLDYLRRRGEEAMQRLVEAGLYQQIDFLSRGEVGRGERVSRDELLRRCRLAGSVNGAMLNFAAQTWDWDPENPNLILHHVRGAGDYPEVMRHVQEGVVTFLVRLAHPDAPPVRSERIAPDHIVYTYDFTGYVEPDE